MEPADPRRPPSPWRPQRLPEPHVAVSRGVLNELARGFLLGLRSEDRDAAARFAAQFLTEQSGTDRPRVRARTVRGPLPRGSVDGRSLEPPP